MKAKRSLGRIVGRLAVIVLLAVTAAGCSGEESNGEPSGGRGHPAVSRDGNWIAFSGNGISVARLGAVANRITDPGKGTDAYPDWSPDGSKIVFTRFGSGSTDPGMLYVVNRGGSGLRRLTKGDDTAPSWSPDGRTIVFTRAEGSDGLDDNVRVIDADGKNLRVLVRDAQDPAWSPDGSKIAFARGVVGGDIAIFDLKSKRITWVVRSKLSTAPAWSPDGTRIAFEDYSDVPSDTPYVIGIPEIYVVNVDGTGLRRLTKDKETDWTPTWTPDGRIVFASFRAGSSRLYVMNGDGSGVRRFAMERENEGH